MTAQQLEHQDQHQEDTTLEVEVVEQIQVHQEQVELEVEEQEQVEDLVVEDQLMLL